MHGNVMKSSPARETSCGNESVAVESLVLKVRCSRCNDA